MRVIETEIRYRKPDGSWLAPAEYETLCCAAGDMPPCRERLEDFHGYTEAEILEKLDITLHDGRDELGRLVEIRWRNIPANGRCGKKLTRIRKNARPCCDTVTAMAWDSTVSAQVMAPDSACIIAVTGGRPPYTWTVGGVGFWLDPGHSLRRGESDSQAISLYADAGACGAATVTVTDHCGHQTAGAVRSTNGRWEFQSRCDAPGCPNYPSYYSYDQVADLIDGDRKYYLGWSSTCQAGTFSEEALACWPALFRAGEVDPVRSVIDSNDTYPLRCDWTANSWSRPYCEGDKCRVCVAMREDYRWVC